MCKGVHFVDLGESFQTHIFLENLASIQPRMSPVKFARPMPSSLPMGRVEVLPKQSRQLAAAREESELLEQNIALKDRQLDAKHEWVTIGRF